MVTCHDMGHTLAYISKVRVWGRLGFPFNNVFQLWFANASNLKICHDANKNAKVEKLFVFFISKSGLLQIYPPYKNLAPRF